MNITLNNYEEYFLLLADNELSPAEETLVRQFATQHPHLQEELQILFNCRLDAADMPVFPKEKLLRPVIWDVENPQPVHAQMLSLLDDELPAMEKEELIRQIAASSVLQAEWATLQKAVLPPEVTVCPDKANLYRQHKIRPLAWMRWAAAAAVIALAWLLWPAKINSSQLAGMAAVIPAVTQKIVVPVLSDNIIIKDTNITQQSIDNTATAAVAITQQRQPNETDITQNKKPEITASAKQNNIAKKEDNRALFKEEVVVPAPEELAVIEPDIATLGNGNSLAVTLTKNENITMQPAQLTPKSTMLTGDALQSTMAMHKNETDEDKSFVHIAGARFDKQKVRGLFRGITRSVTRTFSKSKIQPAETAYTTRNL